MYRVELAIDGMMCGMCEAHVSDAIREVCGPKAKVSASHTKGTAQVVLDGQPDIARIRAAVKKTGYKVTAVAVTPV